VKCAQFTFCTAYTQLCSPWHAVKCHVLCVSYAEQCARPRSVQPREAHTSRGPLHWAAPRRCSNSAHHRSPCFAGGTSRTAPLQFQCVCALRAAPHLPLACPTVVSPPAHCAPTPHQRPCRSPNQSPIRCCARHRATVLPSAHPHPCALHAAPLVSVIAPRCGECRAMLALPFLRWRRTSLLRHRKGEPRQMRIERAVAPLCCSARLHLPALWDDTRSHCAPTSNGAMVGAQCATTGSRHHC
jgi:hypothetical protein